MGETWVSCNWYGEDDNENAVCKQVPAEQQVRDIRDDLSIETSIVSVYYKIIPLSTISSLLGMTH